MPCSLPSKGSAALCRGLHHAKRHGSAGPAPPSKQVCVEDGREEPAGSPWLVPSGVRQTLHGTHNPLLQVSLAQTQFAQRFLSILPGFGGGDGGWFIYFLFFCGRERYRKIVRSV